MAFSQSGTLRRRRREEVDGHRVHADLSEAVREILVLVKTTRVRDHDTPASVGAVARAA
jgi:hypothetical protein